MADRDLLRRAAACYRRAGHLDEAARCYREAAMYREAAAAWEAMGLLGEAVTDLVKAGRPEQAAWLLVHRLGAAGPARALLDRAAEEPAGLPLLRGLVLARCDIADAGGTASPSTLATLDAVMDGVMDELERPAPDADEHELESCAVALAEMVNRPDLVALLFAAAVRGGWSGAAQRWNAWSVRALGVELVLPESVEVGGR